MNEWVLQMVNYKTYCTWTKFTFCNVISIKYSNFFNSTTSLYDEEQTWLQSVVWFGVSLLNRRLLYLLMIFYQKGRGKTLFIINKSRQSLTRQSHKHTNISHFYLCSINRNCFKCWAQVYPYIKTSYETQFKNQVEREFLQWLFNMTIYIQRDWIKYIGLVLFIWFS